MLVGIFINTTKEESNKAANKFGAILRKNDIESKVVNMKEDCKDIDVIAVFGGDGTILRVVDYAIEYNVPILAINTGNVGFLTCLENSELEKAVDILKSKNQIEKRSVMKVLVGNDKYYALNEVLVQRNMLSNSTNGVVELSMEIAGSFVDKFYADGIIIATPTGSTAYSLSAGGSILAPDLNAFIATPVCAHSLHNRPIVYSDSSPCVIKVGQNSKCALFIDGKLVKTLKSTDKIEVLKSKNSVKFYKTNHNFFEKLLAKLNKWSETK